MTGTDFVSQYEDQDGTWNSEIKEKVNNAQFVFAFTETEFSSGGTFSTTGNDIYATTTTHSWVSATEVSQVDILRLKFASKGITYNLGVVIDTTSGDLIPDGIANGLDLSIVGDWFEKILMLVGIMILVVILGYLAPVFSVVFKVLVKCIEWAFKGLLLVISAPFKLIGSLFKTKKRKR